MRTIISNHRLVTLCFLAFNFFLTASFYSQAGIMDFVGFVQDGQGRVEGLAGANSVAMSRDDKFVYVASSGDDAITVLIRNPMTGGVVPIQVIRDNVDGVDGLAGAQSITVSADRKSVYVASWGDNAVAVFGRDPNTGLLTFLQVIKDGDSGGVVDGLSGAYSVTVSADGQSVYVSSQNDHAVAVFERDPATGQLTFQHVLNGQDGVEGLSGATSVTVSTDNQSVYVAGFYDNAVAVFSRSATGQLTFQQAFRNGQNGVEGLAYPTSVTVSADGKSVYVTSIQDNAVAVFARDSHTGLLRFQRKIKDGDGGVNGLAKAYSVVVSHDSRFVYVTGYKDDAIAIFDRTNKAPVNTLPTVPTLNKNTSLTLEQLRIADEDANPLPVKVTLTTTQGTLTLSTTANLTFEQGDGTDEPQLVMTGTVAAINKALKGMIFKPALNFSGEATLQITTHDLGNVGYGGAKSDTDTLKINVLPVNAAPTLEPLKTQYGSPTKLLSFPVKATDPDVPKQIRNEPGRVGKSVALPTLF